MTSNDLVIVNVDPCVLLESVFLNCTFFFITLKYIHNAPINNNPAMVQMMAWRQASSWTNVHRRLYVSPGLNELIEKKKRPQTLVMRLSLL